MPSGRRWTRRPPRLRDAAAKSQLGRYEDAEKFWQNEDMLRLAYDVLDVKVLDPAMGSGHFLVEAVDFVTDRLLYFLNGFPHNPVRAALQRTRRAILASMEEQGAHLTRIPAPIGLFQDRLLVGSGELATLARDCHLRVSRISPEPPVGRSRAAGD